MANVLSGTIGWLVELVREVDRGIAVGYGYEPPERLDRGGAMASKLAEAWMAGAEKRERRLATTAKAIVLRTADA
jgi:hypothetical protein